MSTAVAEPATGRPRLIDPTAPLTATGNLRRRQLVSRGLESGAAVSALIAIAVLAVLVLSIVQRGQSSISWSFFTTNPPLAGGAGGIESALVGSIVIVATATAIALPVGVLIALYVSELAGPESPAGRVLTTAMNVMQGLPTIVVGLFVYGLMVIGGFLVHGETGLAGSVALAIVMLPLIARASQEVLLRVPGSLREAGDALGVNRWRTILGVVLPSAAPGILTGTILAVARAGGETAPLLVVDGLANAATTTGDPLHGVPNIPVQIFVLSESAVPGGFARAWGAALTLIVVILIANIGARVLLARSRRKLGE